MVTQTCCLHLTLLFVGDDNAAEYDLSRKTLMAAGRSSFVCHYTWAAFDLWRLGSSVGKAVKFSGRLRVQAPSDEAEAGPVNNTDVVNGKSCRAR